MKRKKIKVDMTELEILDVGFCCVFSILINYIAANIIGE